MAKKKGGGGLPRKSLLKSTEYRAQRSNDLTGIYKDECRKDRKVDFAVINVQGKFLNRRSRMSQS